MLAQATFTNETASGWQQVTFSSPVAVTAGTTYVVSYLAPKGHYSLTADGFTNQVNARSPLRPGHRQRAQRQRVFIYAASSTFPTGTYNASNYLVDPVFTTTSVARRADGRHRDRRQRQRHRVVDPRRRDR